MENHTLPSVCKRWDQSQRRWYLPSYLCNILITRSKWAGVPKTCPKQFGLDDFLQKKFEWNWRISRRWNTHTKRRRWDGFFIRWWVVPNHEDHQQNSASFCISWDGRIIQLGKSGLKLSVIKASQKATARVDQGKQSLEGVLRSRLSWINEGRVEEDRLKQLVGKFNASRRNGDPKVCRAAQSCINL